ncbi:MAG: hypothetical protein AAF568_02750, partial [Pseudomonadota bacterium]
EEVTRKLGTPLVTSQALIDAVRGAGADPHMILPGLRIGSVEKIRGRREALSLWQLDRPAPRPVQP